MLSKAVTIALLALILSPFTAPFTTCDVAVLLGATSHDLPSTGSEPTLHVMTDAAPIPYVSRSGVDAPRLALLPLAVVPVCSDVLGDHDGQASCGNRFAIERPPTILRV